MREVVGAIIINEAVIIGFFHASYCCLSYFQDLAASGPFKVASFRDAVTWQYLCGVKE